MEPSVRCTAALWGICARCRAGTKAKKRSMLCEKCMMLNIRNGPAAASKPNQKHQHCTRLHGVYADILLTTQLPHRSAISQFCKIGFTTRKKDFLAVCIASKPLSIEIPPAGYCFRRDADNFADKK
nr:MAG TPA: hypothetical protein [Caudoviricetes sp.]